MPSSLVVLQTYGRILDARLSQSRLQAAGIPAFLPDEQMASLDPLVFGTIAGVRLQVREHDLERAREVLSHTPDDHDEPDEHDEPACPRCESTYWSHKWSWPQLAAGVLLFGVPFRWMQKRAFCARCEHVWDGTAARPLATYRSVAGHARRKGRPVFLLRRSRAAMGTFWGFAAGLFVAMVTAVPPGLLLLLGPLVGFALGKLSQYHVCSDPSCRAPLLPRHAACAACKGTVEGLIVSPHEHYVRKAEWHRG